MSEWILSKNLGRYIFYTAETEVAIGGIALSTIGNAHGMRDAAITSITYRTRRSNLRKVINEPTYVIGTRKWIPVRRLFVEV